jgi:hypothetical protein
MHSLLVARVNNKKRTLFERSAHCERSIQLQVSIHTVKEIQLPDSEMDEDDPDEEEFVLEIVEVLHSETERLLESALCAFNCSNRRLR